MTYILHIQCTCTTPSSLTHMHVQCYVHICPLHVHVHVLPSSLSWCLSRAMSLSNTSDRPKCLGTIPPSTCTVGEGEINSSYEEAKKLHKLSTLTCCTCNCSYRHTRSNELQSMSDLTLVGI